MKIIKPTKMAAGFYVTAASALFAVISAICYGVLFSGIKYKEPVFNLAICILLVVAAVVAVVLLLKGKQFAGFSPAILCLCSGISFMMFVKMVIWPISDTIYGIEPFPQFKQLIICAMLLLVNFVVSEVALYMKKYE
jgi:hypothetical protein